jgi:hypothetical protein
MKTLILSEMAAPAVHYVKKSNRKKITDWIGEYPVFDAAAGIYS